MLFPVLVRAAFRCSAIAPATFVLLLAACGGSDDPPPPRVDLLSTPIARMVAVGTPVFIEASLKPNFAPTGTLHVEVDDASGAFVPATTLVQNADGSIVVSMSTSTHAAVGRHAGDLTLKLCADAACNTRQPVGSVALPFEVQVLGAGSAWLGDHLTPLGAWNGVADWTMYQRDAAHTGHVPVRLDPNVFSTRWQFAAPVAAPGAAWVLPGSLVATAAGRLYLAHDKLLQARSEFDASLLWEYDFSGLDYPSVNPPAVVDGTVYVAAGQQSSTFLYAFESGNGTLKFKAPMSSQWESYLPPTVGAQGVYTNAGTYGGMYAFGVAGDQLFFQNTLPQTSMWTPAIDANGVYAYTGRLQVFDPLTGAELVSIADPSFENYVYEIGGSPVLGTDSVFVANYANSALNGGAIGNRLLRFQPSTATIAWQFEGAYPSTPAYADGVVYAANHRPLRLEARAEDDGALLWSWVPPLASDTGFVSEVLLTDNLALVSTASAVYAVDLRTHRTVWSYPSPGRLALSSNGILYIRGAATTVAINVK